MRHLRCSCLFFRFTTNVSTMPDVIDVIDLTHDDDDDDCSDVELVDPVTTDTAAASIELGDDDEFVLTGEVGDVALRDYPHNRHDCMAVTPFVHAKAASNRVTCAMVGGLLFVCCFFATLRE